MSDRDRTVLRNGARIHSGFTVIPNACLQDYALSLAAHAVLLRILSLPPMWIFYKSWAQKEYKIGRDKLDDIIRELVKAQYCRFERLRNPDGTLGASCFTFTDTKGVFHQDTENPVVDEKTGLDKGSDHTLISPRQVKSAPIKNLLTSLENNEEEARASPSPVDNRADDQRISRAQQLRAIAAEIRSAERPKAECRQGGTKAFTPAPSGLSPSTVGDDRPERGQEGPAKAYLPEEAGLVTGKGLGSEQVDAPPQQNSTIPARGTACIEADRISNVRNTERLERWVGRMRRELATVMAKPPGFAIA